MEQLLFPVLFSVLFFSQAQTMYLCLLPYFSVCLLEIVLAESPPKGLLGLGLPVVPLTDSWSIAFLMVIGKRNFLC